MRHQIQRVHARGGSIILKADDYYKRQSDKLRAVALSEQGKIFEEHVVGVLQAAEAGRDALDLSLENLDRDLGDRLGEAMREEGARITSRVYSRGMIEILDGGEWEFNSTDRLALHYLEDTEIVYWVGNHWGDKVSTAVKDAVAPAFTEGWTRLELIEKLKGTFADQIRRSDSYWSGLAANAVTRSRGFGITEAATQAGLTQGTIRAFLDDVTSDVCRYLNGKKVLVSDMRQLRDSILSAQDPEAVKELAPWLSLEELKALVTPEGRIPVSHSLPPYHFHCRSYVEFG